ncbi:hypothetical protein [Glutamicibacter sp. AOP3-A1-12]|uniref:hypothetical protein n=1 Tax=Glutamicibacter sp. AOP3-A1-12 TaxID=3457701 RepID=UPI00403475B2
MRKSKVLGITRVSRSNSDAFVEFNFSGDATQYVWSCPISSRKHAVHHELIMVKFLSSNLEAFCSQTLSSIEIECSVGFSKTFKDLFNLIQIIEPMLQSRVRIKYDQSTLVHPVFELRDPGTMETRQEFEASSSAGQPLVNLRIIDDLLSSLIMSSDSREPQGHALFAKSLIWTVENSRSTYTNGYAATRTFLDIFQRAMRSLIGEKVHLSVDLVDEERSYVLLKRYSDRPQEFEACVQALSRMDSVAAGNSSVTADLENWFTVQLLNWPSMGEVERRTVISALPSGIEPLMYKYSSHLSPSSDLSNSQGDGGKTYFWTKKGWAYFGQLSSIKIRWGMLYEEV